MTARKGIDQLLDKHPLQRFASPSREASLILHSLGIVSFCLSFKYLLDNPNPANESYGWHFQFLTIIGLALALLTFLTGAIADITLSKNLFLIKNGLLFCSAPLETLISILYWGLRAIDESLVVPEWGQLNMSADIGFHAIPSILLAIDLLFFSPPWTLGTLPAMAISTGIAFGYWFWIEACYQKNGWYPYPIFEMASTSQRVALFLGSAVLMTSSAALLSLLYRRINGIGTEHPGSLKTKKRN